MESNTLPKKYSSKLVLLCLLFVTPCLAFAQAGEIDQTIPDTVLIKVVEENGDFTFNLYETDDCSAALPSISFVGMLSKLTPAAQSILKSVASQIKNNPTCKVKVTGYANMSKRGMQSSWDRVNAVINFLVEKQGISQDRFIFEYGQDGGDVKLVDLAFSNEDGPEMVPAPHPHLQSSSKPASTTVQSSTKKVIKKKAVVKQPIKKKP